jgi:hypothetical protein
MPKHILKISMVPTSASRRKLISMHSNELHNCRAPKADTDLLALKAKQANLNFQVPLSFKESRSC